MLAFSNVDATSLDPLSWLDTSLNFCFFFDIFVNFFSAFTDDEYNVVDDHTVPQYAKLTLIRPSLYRTSKAGSSLT